VTARVTARVVAAVLGLALASFAAMGALDLLWSALGQGTLMFEWAEWYEEARARAWEEVSVWLPVGLVGAGLVLLALALWPRGPGEVVHLAGRRPEVRWVVPRRDLARDVERLAGRVVGADRVRSRPADRRIAVSVRTSRADAHAVEAELRRVVGAELARLRVGDGDHHGAEPELDVHVRRVRR
jgi:hypothetical protein